MTMVFRVRQRVLDLTFDHLRSCGRGQKECQLLWTSSWNTPEEITGVVHPKHRAHAGGFDVQSDWLTGFWLELFERNEGIRVQVHTHPREAFHSRTDDAYPVLHTPGFLSLVIPTFAQGEVGFRGAFLAQMGADGRFRKVRIERHFEVLP